MGVAFEATCDACQARFKVVEGPTRFGDRVRCQSCGRTSGVEREARRLQAHLAALVSAEHQAARASVEREIGETRAQLEERRESLLYALLGERTTRKIRDRLSLLDLRRAALALEEKQLLDRHPLPTLPDPRCPCGGVMTSDAPVRCPACRGTRWTRDPTGAEEMVD